MRTSRSSALAAIVAMGLIVALLGLWAPVAEAAARVLAPAGWWESSGAAPEAQRRAGRWRDALQLRMTQVVSAPDDDRFAETAAMFERAEPVAAERFESEEAAVELLSTLVTNVVGSEAPARSELRETSSGQTVVWAQWIVDDLAYECVLAPSGESASVLVMAVLAEELEDQRPALDGLVAGLEGVTEPMPKFSLRAWRIGSVLCWIALAVLLHAIMLAFVDREQDHRQAGQRAAGALAILVLIGTGGTIALLSSRELAIVYAGSSVNALALWVGVAGLVVVGAHLMIIMRLDSGKVQSAPSSGVYSRTDMLRSSVTRSGMRVKAEDIAAASGTWAKTPQPGAQEPTPPPAASANRIVIDEAEREPERP